MVKMPFGTLRFNHPKSYQFLRENGFVYTIRGHCKKFRRVVIMHNGAKVALGKAELIDKVLWWENGKRRINFPLLEKYVEYSGFDSVEEWLSTAMRLNGLQFLYLYKITVWRWYI